MPFNINRTSIILLTIVLFTGSIDLSYGQVDKEMKGWMLGGELEKVYYEGDQEAFNSLFDMEYIYGQILEESEEPSVVTFNEGIKSEGVTQGLWNELIYQIQNGTYYNYVGHKTYDDRIEVLFRLFSDSGLNYHNYIFHQVEEEYKIKDVFLYITGEYFTESLATAFRNIFASMNGATDNLEIDYTTMIRLTEVNNLLQEGKNEEAIRIIEEEIDKKYQNHRKVLIFKLRALNDVTSEDYLDVVDKLSKMTDVKSTLFLLGIDRYFIVGEYDESMKMVDSLGMLTGDAMLDHYRGNIYLAQGRIDEAIVSFQRLKDNFPYLPESYDNLVDLYYQLMEYEKAFKILKEAHLNIQLSKSELSSIIDQQYPMISNQLYYQDWLESITSDFEAIATSITEELVDIWQLEKISDLDGNSMKVPDGLDQWIFNADYSCFIKHEKEEETGLWEYDLTTDQLFLYLPIDDQSEEGKKFMQEGEFFEDDAGNKFSRKNLDISVLCGSRMSVVDETGIVLTFKRAASGVGFEKFEGKVVYQNVVKDKSGNYTSKEIEHMIGDYYTYYVKGNKNRTEASGLYKGIKLYAGGDTIYSFEANADTVYYELISEKQEEVIDWEIIEEGPEILGFKTKRFFYQTLQESNEIYYSDELQIEVQDKDIDPGAWNFFYHMTSSVGLKSLLDDPENTIEALASKVIAIELPESLFEVPRGVRVSLNE
jgi:tetratricopeptide (TPR) repeat protein